MSTPDVSAHPQLAATGLAELMAVTAGSPEVAVAVIDGPADLNHPDLRTQPISDLRSAVAPPGPPPGGEHGTASAHGTFVVGMLSARRTGPAPGISPGCRLLLYPVLPGTRGWRAGPTVTAEHLAAALLDVIEAGARIVNLSLGVTAGALTRSQAVDDAVGYAARNGVLVVAAAGNHGTVGPAPMLSHPWIIPVAACDTAGHLLPRSNVGITIGRHGLLAPGAGIVGLAPGGGYRRLTGTSVAAPLVTGAAALLWSLAPRAPAARIRQVLTSTRNHRRSIVPPRLDAAASWRLLSHRQPPS